MKPIKDEIALAVQPLMIFGFMFLLILGSAVIVALMFWWLLPQPVAIAIYSAPYDMLWWEGLERVITFPPSIESVEIGIAAVIPYGVWLATALIFAWCARRLELGKQFLAALGVIIAVIMMMNCVLTALGLRATVIWL